MAMDVDWDVVDGFIGSEQLYAWWVGGIRITEGVHYLSQHGLSWLVDIIATSQILPDVRNEPFQLWELTLWGDGGNGAFVECKRDSDEDPVYSQRVDHTDCPRNLKLYMTNHTLMLLSEY